MVTASAKIRGIPHTLTERLARGMERLAKLYDDLVKVAEHKREALVKLDLDLLGRCVQAEDLLVGNIRKVDQGREKAIQAIGQCPGGAAIRASESPLSALLGLLDDERAGELFVLKRRLTDAAGKLAKLNALNQALCEQSLKHTSAFLSLLTGAGEGQCAVYDGAGSEKHLATRSLVDRRA